jgi:lambda repressor-like predicted transcriptional regulator
MTALGKTLVFFNLLFSLVIGGLIVTVYVTRTNWKNGYEEALKQRDAAISSRTALDKQRTDEAQKFNATIKQLQGELDVTTRNLNEKTTELANLNTQLSSFKAISSTEKTNAQTATIEIGKLHNERDQMASQMTERNQIILNLEKEHVTLRNRAVSAEIARNATQERLDKLMISYEQMVAQINDLRSRGIVAGPAQGSRSAPVEVRGKVLGTADDLATISLGSDHGLQTGNLLQVYRMSPAPTWVGTLQVIKTEPHYALGKFTPNGRNVIRKDDTVDSKILLK